MNLSHRNRSASSRCCKPFVRSPNQATPEYMGGYTPAEIRSVYSFSPEFTGAGQVIAIIGAYGHPTIESDLLVFSEFFGLPKADISTHHTGELPTQYSDDWALEIAMDTEWEHALAPEAKLLLVTAPSGEISDLLYAANYAVQLGANVVSMSWGETEFFEEDYTGPVFKDNPDVTFVAAAGDHPAVPAYPSVSPYVISAGATSLQITNGQRSSEVAWSDCGGGPSVYYPCPLFQQKMQGVCNDTKSARNTPDVGFCGDPDYGVAVYNTYSVFGSPGWHIAGGSSLAAPCWSAIAAESGRRGRQLTPSLLYQLAGETVYTIPQTHFYDITQGGNGTYNAHPGWDFCTGLGSPNAQAILDGLRL